MKERQKKKQGDCPDHLRLKEHLFIKWGKNNDVGIPLIDEQHRGIVSIINSFFHMLRGRANNQLLYSVISDTLKNYSRIHFITEEELLTAIGYEHLEEHKKIHRHLTVEIERMEHKCILANDATPLLEFLKKWWFDHINTEDHHYVPYLQEYISTHRRER